MPFNFRLCNWDDQSAASIQVSKSLLDELNTLAVVYRHPSSAFLCTEPLPFCGRPAKPHPKMPNPKPLSEGPATTSHLDFGVSASHTETGQMTETAHASSNSPAALVDGASHLPQNHQANEEGRHWGLGFRV